MQIKGKIISSIIIINFVYAFIILNFYFKIIGFENNENIINALRDDIIILFIIIFLFVAGSILFIHLLFKPTKRFKVVIDRILNGDLDSRLGIKNGGEFQEIGDLIDVLLNKYTNKLNRIEDENENLNDSIISLLKTVMQLEKKNFAIKAKVNEDITGPLADALNLMTTEVASALKKASDKASDITKISASLKTQSDDIYSLFNKEQDEIEKTNIELKSATISMTRIKQLAEQSNETTKNTIKSTVTAIDTIKNTVSSINNISEIINENESRIKRLGERSQEINSAVNLISDISEKTHILALNASMHAASAGDAGRGFVVIADEVKRLAETTKEATSQTKTLANNIQLETINTVKSMSDLDNQIIHTNKLAGNAEDQIEETHTATIELVNMIEKIAENATAQAKISNQLLKRAGIIKDNKRSTISKLQKQSVYTDELYEHSNKLKNSLDKFKLKNNKSANL